MIERAATDALGAFARSGRWGRSRDLNRPGCFARIGLSRRKRLGSRTSLPTAIVRWRIEASGTVQLVGYRERVLRAAEAHHIVGSVENDKKHTSRVLIDAQGAPADVEDFLTEVRGPEGRSDAKEVAKVEQERPDPSLGRFQVKRGRTRLETLERVDLARHGVAELLAQVEALKGELEAQSTASRDAFDRLGQAVGGVASALAGEEDDSRKGLLTLAQELGTEIAEVGKRVDGVERALAQTDKKLTEGMKRFEGAQALLVKSLDRIERSLERESEEQESQARASEQQRNALLNLADQLTRSAPVRPRRRGKS